MVLCELIGLQICPNSGKVDEIGLILFESQTADCE